MASENPVFDKNSTVAIIPRPDEQFVIPDGHSAELILVNKHTPNEITRITPNDSPKDTYSVVQETSHDENPHSICSASPLQEALTCAADMEGFSLQVADTPLIPGDDMVDNPSPEFILDPQGLGGLVINDEDAHLPITIRSGDTDTRIRCATTPELRTDAYGGYYIFETRTETDPNWTSRGKGNHPVQPPLIFHGHFENAFQTWTPRMDIPFRQRVNEANAL